MARTFYDVLGASRSAGQDELRRAYLAKARQLHPDRYIDAGTEQRRAAERSMQELNEAWRVLGDSGRRRRYDVTLEPTGPGRSRWADEDATRFTVRPDGTMPEEVDVAPTVHLIRGLPWIALIVVLFAIFVFTAYAVTGGGSSKTGPTTGVQAACVTIAAGPGGQGEVVRPASCDSPGAHRLVTRVPVASPCPAGTQRVQPADEQVVYCLQV